MSHRLRIARAAAVAALPVLAACATNPATGKSELMLVSEEQEIQMGREADRDVGASIGLYPDQDLQAYVERIGRALAADSERPKLPWTFRVVDDPAVNAFALPGGFIYVTRGILAHLDSEAELASVLGHEIGHVTARHSASQISKAQFATLGLGLGMVLKPELARFGDLAQTGLSLMFLKFGRDDEREADGLGLRYATRENYQPKEMIEVFHLLDSVGAASCSERLPQWLYTHPNPGDRAQRIEEQIRETRARGEVVNQKGYMRQIDGIMFGENPREGFFVGDTFYHPEMKFQIEFPRGWKGQNQRTVVGALSPNQDAIVSITLSSRTSPDAAANEFFSQRGLQSSRPQRTEINDLPAVAAAFEANTTDGAIAGTAAFVEHGGKVFRILGYTPSARYGTYDSVFDDAIRSFDRLTDRRYLDVQPKRIEVVDVERDMPVGEFARRYPSTVKPETLALINNVTASEPFQGGQLAKRVVGGRLPGDRASLDEQR
jgi:predicted Zn-dependent protease